LRNLRIIGGPGILCPAVPIPTIRSARVRRPVGVPPAAGNGSNASRWIELEPLDLRVQMGVRDHVREIDRHPRLACFAGSRDQAALLADERPKGSNQVSHRMTVEHEGLQPNLGRPADEHMIEHRVDLATADIDVSGRPEARLEQCVDRGAIAIDDVGEILLVGQIAPAFLDGVDHHHLQQQRSEPEAACSRVNHQAADLGLGRRCGPTRCRLNDAGAENVLGAAVHDVKQPALPCRITEYVRRTVEQRSLVQRLDEGEGKPVFGLARQPDLDSVLIPIIAGLCTIYRRLACWVMSRVNCQ
jgi:hypothetical protein